MMQSAAIVNLVLIASLSGTPHAPDMSSAPPNTKLATVLCFKTGEQTSGMNKICYYDCLGSAAAITIGAAELCPLSINH
jgi:hypothetical protein